MALPFAFSPSSISTFRDCPRKFKLTKDKVIVWQETPSKQRGTLVHKYMEEQIKGVENPSVCPDGVNVYYTQDLINRFKPYREPKPDRQLFLEHEMCVNDKWKSCGWFDDDVMIRSRADLLVLDIVNRHALVGDFKTGKIYPGMDLQLRTYALMCYVLYGMLHITWELYYLDQGQTKSGTIEMTENDYSSCQDVLDIMTNAINCVNTGGFFPASKNIFCKFCSVYHDKNWCPESLSW